ncbi:Spy/CpxP family protein refolding chaperone [Gellertiella hungarica]|uniref:Spy/CpxP family protein refolding chaperone n=1 Tax=Gellertiella hungarica TaxID=1572859 RepID=A0A7W6J7Q2_9HYPH|nr:Spy/CpxP family protein refolding chaperone [Gellertiella hungarica]MBB4066346.1 Spy/CpxP family protein refolding chaperone [Gellertiella hungarica]
MAKERSRFRVTLLASAVVVGGLGLIGAIGAVQAHGPFNPMRGFGPGFSGHFASSVLEEALVSVDATDLQREQIRSILDEAGAEIRLRMSEAGTRKQQFASLLAAETIEAAAFESLRQEMLETGDTVSARALEAFLDVAEVLTAEQRAELIRRRSGFGHGFGGN